MLIQIFSRILLPCPCSNGAQNAISSSVGGSDYFLQISSKSGHFRVKRIKNADVGTGHHNRHHGMVKTIKT